MKHETISSSTFWLLSTLTTESKSRLCCLEGNKMKMKMKLMMVTLSIYTFLMFVISISFLFPSRTIFFSYPSDMGLRRNHKVIIPFEVDSLANRNREKKQKRKKKYPPKPFIPFHCQWDCLLDVLHANGILEFDVAH